jgi:formylglycine-generating enzyme required for sulfatase activity/serine/threonine protein kinase
MSEDLIGLRLGEVEIQEFLGNEGIAEVYRATDPASGKPVLIRLVGRNWPEDPAWNAHFRREVKNIASLRHANISAALDFGEALGGHYMISEFPDGTLLASIIAEIHNGERTPAPEDITFWVRQIAAALDYAHSSGVIHRDVNPSRILLTRSGQAILLDFGLSLLLSRGAGDAAQGAAFGAVNYMAPEQASDYYAATPASDIYSLGVVVFEMITGDLPFMAGSDVDTILRAMSDSAPDPRLLQPDLPVSVSRVVLKALSKSARERHKNAMQLASDLEWAYAHPNEIAEPLLPPAGQPKKKSRRRSDSEVPEMPVAPRPTAERIPRRGVVPFSSEWREKQRMRSEHRRIHREQSDRQKRIRQEKIAERKRIKQEQQRERWQAFWKRWGQMITSMGVFTVLAAGIVAGLNAAGVISIAVQLPAQPALPAVDLSGLIPPTQQPTPTLFILPDMGVSTNQPTGIPTDASEQSPTPLQSEAQSSVPSLAITPLEIGTSAFRSYDGMVMQFVPAGQFQMGTDDLNRSEHAKPRHPVMLSDYWIDRTEVTNAQYSLCMDSNICKPPTSRFFFDDPNYEDFPAVFVPYESAVSYCLWIAGRTSQAIGLPTEAQWEKAAGWEPLTETSRVFPWGNDFITGNEMRFFGSAGDRPASRVGSHPSGVSAYGVQDMAGNVWEWTSDWYDPDYYKRTGVAVDPGGPSTGTERVTRGGSWRDPANLAVTTVRNPARPSISGDALGFRCAMNGAYPDPASGINLGGRDAIQALAKMIQEGQALAANDPTVLSAWLSALSQIDQALVAGDSSQARTLVEIQRARLVDQRVARSMVGTLSARLDSGMAWLSKRLGEQIALTPTPTITPSPTITPTPTQTPIVTPTATAGPASPTATP